MDEENELTMVDVFYYLCLLLENLNALLEGHSVVLNSLFSDFLLNKKWVTIDSVFDNSYVLVQGVENDVEDFMVYINQFLL